MRLISLASGVAVSVTTSLAFAQSTPSESRPTATPVANVAPVGPANGPAAASHYSTSTTNIGVLVADPAAMAILAKYIPGVAENPSGIAQASPMTLKQLQQYSPDKLSDKMLTDIDTEFARIPAKK